MWFVWFAVGIITLLTLLKQGTELTVRTANIRTAKTSLSDLQWMGSRYVIFCFWDGFGINCF